MQAAQAFRMHSKTVNKAASPGRAHRLANPRLPTPINSSTTNPLAPSTQPRSAHIMRYKTDQQQEQQQQKDTSNATGTNNLSRNALSKVVGDQQQQQQQVSVQLSADDVMADMCTMLGGISKECFTGYAGQWRTWEVLSTNQLHQQHNDSQTEPPSDPPAKCATSKGQHSIRLIDDGVNVRLWRVQEGSIGLQKAEAAAAASEETIQQANFYHHPTKMAGPSTRFAPYLTGNTMSGRPDGYGLRVWSFTKDSEMLKPDASSWLDGSGTPSECSMRVLTVPDRGTTIINGSLPSGFDEGHNPRFWVLEFIAKDPGSSDRRWASMNWYDLGDLVVNRSINEDCIQLSGEPDDIRINPQDIHFGDRRQGLLPLEIDSWASQHTQTQQGTATVFSFASVPGDQGEQELHLVRTSDLPCSWTNPFEEQHASRSSSSSSSSSSSKESQGRQQQQQDQGGVDFMVQVYPDWSYCRVPRSIREVVGSGLDTAVFEAGTVLRNGSLVRWLLEYETSGKRLIKSARFETYPAA